MSHEIRTPLNGILGFAGLMAESELTGLQREHNEAVRSSAENLLVVINDILDFSRVEAGRLELESLDFSLRKCVEDALGSVQSLAAEKGLATSVQIDERRAGLGPRRPAPAAPGPPQFVGQRPEVHRRRRHRGARVPGSGTAQTTPRRLRRIPRRRRSSLPFPTPALASPSFNAN
jgi:signal transduction histidine kinase